MYVASKPATTIATNGVFILDEFADLKTIQVGGTLGWDSYYSHSLGDKANTYLYLKGVDNNGERAYLQITIQPEYKAILIPEMTSQFIDQNGKILQKMVDYSIAIVNIETNFNDSSIRNENSLWYSASFDEDGTIFYCNVEKILESIGLLQTVDHSHFKLVKEPVKPNLLCETLSR